MCPQRPVSLGREITADGGSHNEGFMSQNPYPVTPPVPLDYSEESGEGDVSPGSSSCFIEAFKFSIDPQNMTRFV